MYTRAMFSEILAVGGKTNSLGRAEEVIDAVLHDKSRLEELYGCLFDDDAWVRMRAADSIEKVCRQHPDWLEPFIDRFATDLSASSQPSILWHLAQIYTEVPLTDSQKAFAIDWLKGLIATVEVDWIVSSNAMDALVHFSSDGSLPVPEIIPLLQVQQKHHSKAVVRRANKLLDMLMLK